MGAVLVNLEEAALRQEGALLQPPSENFLPMLGHAAETDGWAGRWFQIAEVMFIVHAP